MVSVILSCCYFPLIEIFCFEKKLNAIDGEYNTKYPELKPTITVLCC